jgi:phosphonate metabolism-associated iron-containing alcohol dehydrogenase
MSRYHNPVAVGFDAAGVADLAAALAQRPEERRILLLTRGGEVEAHPALAPLRALLAQREVHHEVVTLGNPDLRDVPPLKAVTDAFPYQLIVAIGGGSVLDLAKILAALRDQPGTDLATLRDLVVTRRYAEAASFVPWVGLPTTAGTGSEVTCWATLWDGEAKLKHSVTDERLYARQAIIVPELTLTLPPAATAYTGLDALCHATEAYWAVRTNPITRVHALAAIRLLRQYLPRLARQGDDLNARRAVARASLHAGLAFSATRTTACHSISYPLTLRHGIPHGVAASLTLAAMLVHNESALVEGEALYKAFGVSTAAAVAGVVRDWQADWGISPRLRDHGLTAADLPAIVAGAYTQGRMDNNPVELPPVKLQAMLQRLW